MVFRLEWIVTIRLLRMVSLLTAYILRKLYFPRVQEIGFKLLRLFCDVNVQNGVSILLLNLEASHHLLSIDVLLRYLIPLFLKFLA
jgi:hypothetical protein